jgi:two-component system LytT family response regulator
MQLVQDAGRTGRLRTLIVDAQETERLSLCAELKVERDLEIVGEAATALEAQRKIAELQPDLVFLDIEQAGPAGTDVLGDVGGADPYLILMAARAESAIPAFEMQAGDCLLKPVQRPRLQISVERARRRIVEKRVAALAFQIVGAIDSLSRRAPVDTPETTQNPATGYPDHLRVRVRRRLYSLAMSDILWVQGASQYCRLHTKRGEFVLARTLASLECQLDPRRFFRIHRSAIVNAAHVREVRSTGEGRYNVYLNGGLALPMGRARREILDKLLIGVGSRNN